MGEQELVFVVDASYPTTDTQDWTQLLRFVRRIVRSYITVSQTTVRVAFVRYGSSGASVEMALSSTTNNDAVLNAITSIPFDGTASDLVSALRYTRTTVLSSENVRAGVQQLVIAFTDGASVVSQSDVQSELAAYQAANINLIGVAVLDVSTNSVIQPLLSSYPQGVVVSDYDVLQQQLSTVRQWICPGTVRFVCHF
jgi:Mg-chelatase subunit ChlD